MSGSGLTYEQKTQIINDCKALKTLRPGKEQMLAWQEQFGGIKSFKIQVFLRKQIKRINYNARKALREASSSTAPSDSPSPDDAIDDETLARLLEELTVESEKVDEGTEDMDVE